MHRHVIFPVLIVLLIALFYRGDDDGRKRTQFQKSKKPKTSNDKTATVLKEKQKVKKTTDKLPPATPSPPITPPPTPPQPCFGPFPEQATSAISRAKTERCRSELLDIACRVQQNVNAIQNKNQAEIVIGRHENKTGSGAYSIRPFVVGTPGNVSACFESLADLLTTALGVGSIVSEVSKEILIYKTNTTRQFDIEINPTSLYKTTNKEEIEACRCASVCWTTATEANTA